MVSRVSSVLIEKLVKTWKKIFKEKVSHETISIVDTIKYQVQLKTEGIRLSSLTSISIHKDLLDIVFR